MCGPLGSFAARCWTAVAAVRSWVSVSFFSEPSSSAPATASFACCVAVAAGGAAPSADGAFGASGVGEGAGGSVAMPASWTFSVASVRTSGL